jgi:putative two-component system response regulator
MDMAVDARTMMGALVGQPELSQPRILIVDDDESNVQLLEGLLDIGGYDFVRSAMGGKEALEQAEKFLPDLILLDLQMPGIDGYHVLEKLRRDLSSAVYLPILVVTADATRSARKKALELGASDFLTKPVDATEILLRIKNFLTMRALSHEANERNIDLEEKVRERTHELELTQIEIVQRLAMAGERRDDETGEHTKRVGELSATIANSMGLAKRTVQLIRLAAGLHDLGKIGVPDSILLKPGKLTKDEYSDMQTHCRSGAMILAGSQSPLLQMAERIAMSHHERFDGTGYPCGLAGKDIPIEARIVSVADVFDALTHSRPYKEAWDVSAAIGEICSKSGSQFDPEVIRAFVRISLDIKNC